MRNHLARRLLRRFELAGKSRPDLRIHGAFGLGVHSEHDDISVTGLAAVM